ncbi:MAG: hypothetical protein E7376_02300 [Clostridiales bacterium]|nr:hypothetical protein [Clostridiales bacterium]
MDILAISKTLATVAKVKKISDNEYEILTEAKINSKTPIKMYLYEGHNGVMLGDRKHTLKYMNQLYELKSPDVKGCIASVIKIYGFSIVSGELVASIVSDKFALETFYNYIICVGQLANMYAFFDKP